MRPGESFVSQPVRSLQTMLRVLAEDDEELLALIPDGIYGSQTRQAVSAFQHLSEAAARAFAPSMVIFVPSRTS